APDRPGMVEVAVEDDGVGIPAEQLPRIFEKYVRVAHPDTAGARRLGLGLSLVKALAEAHGGRVEVDSLPGKGSRFRLLLPEVKGHFLPIFRIVVLDTPARRRVRCLFGHAATGRGGGADGGGRGQAAGRAKARRRPGRDQSSRSGPAHPARELPGGGEDRRRRAHPPDGQRQADSRLGLRLQAALHDGEDQARQGARVHPVTRMSRERMFALADRIVADLTATESVIIKGVDEKAHGQLRTEVFRVLEDESKLEESIDQEVRRSLSTYSRPAPEGSAEWELLYQKTRDEVYRRRFRL